MSGLQTRWQSKFPGKFEVVEVPDFAVDGAYDEAAKGEHFRTLHLSDVIAQTQLLQASTLLLTSPLPSSPLLPTKIPSKSPSKAPSTPSEPLLPTLPSNASSSPLRLSLLVLLNKEHQQKPSMNHLGSRRASLTLKTFPKTTL